MRQPLRFSLGRRALLLGASAMGVSFFSGRLAAQTLGLPADDVRTARAIAASVRDGSLTAEIALATALDRQAVAQEVNAFTELRPDAALSEARDIDAARDGGATLGALAGVPLGVKDNVDIAGWPTAAGTPALAENIAETNAPSVARLIEAGAIIVGKTNMHELGLGGTSSNAH